MGRPAAALLLLLLILFGNACVAPPRPKAAIPSSATPTGIESAFLVAPSGAVPPVSRPDMSRGFGLSDECDYPSTPLTVAQLLRYVGKSPGDPVAAIMFRVTAVAKPRWNTSDGQRPTQALANAMANAGVQPAIYTPISGDVVRVYRGSVPVAEATLYAMVGAIGQDRVSGCIFDSPTSLQIRGGPDTVHVGGSYLTFLTDRLLYGTYIGPYVTPAVEDIYVVRGGKVIGPAGNPEPLPN